LEEVCAEHGSDGPAFSVFAEDITRQDCVMAGVEQAIPEFNIFNGGFFVSPVIETAEFQEDVTADEPAAGPESLCLSGILVKIARLMDVMVEQVSELADEAWVSWGVVIGAKQGVDQRITMDMIEGIGDGVGLDSDIGIEEEDPLAASFVASKVSGGGWATSFWKCKESGFEVLGDLGGVIG
jgi:hypothetical protein